jgi:tRNA pseudouridine-54 N-methylase
MSKNMHNKIIYFPGNCNKILQPQTRGKMGKNAKCAHQQAEIASKETRSFSPGSFINFSGFTRGRD